MEKLTIPPIRLLNALALAFALIIACAPSATGCLNEHDPNERGPSAAKDIAEALERHDLAQPWPTRRDWLREQLKKTNDYKIRNDLAVALLHTGETQEAIAILEQIEAERPGDYRTASNLGTAYELAGDNTKALEWITKGAERNPDSHSGSEWIHLAILRAKIASGAAKGASVLGLDFGGADEFPKMPRTLPKGLRGEPLSGSDVAQAIHIQLHERLQFTKPPDPLVAELILDLANFTALEPDGLKGWGVADLYDLAEKYDPTNPGVLKRKSMVELHSSRSRSSGAGFLMLLAVIVGTYFLLRLNKLREYD